MTDRPDVPESSVADCFQQERNRLVGVAYRLLGSTSEAEDAVQEAWLRLSRSDPESVENMSAWLTTVVARISLNMLRDRRSRREDPLDDQADRDRSLTADSGTQSRSTQPEQQAVLADSVGLALLVVLDTLTPGERLAFVLHDMFDLPFDQIAPIVDRSPAAARQLAALAGECAARPNRTRTYTDSAGWSRRTSPPPAAETSTRHWPCSTPTSSCTQTGRLAPPRAPPP